MSNLYSVNLGGDDAFSATDHADFKPTGAFTVGAWIKTSTTGAARYFFVSMSQNPNVAGWKLRQNSSNKAEFLTGKNTGTVNGTDYKLITGGTTITDGAWHWVVVTWDGSNLNLYVDGNSDADAVAWTDAPAYAATNYVRVGCQCLAGTDANFFTGNLDEIFLLNGTAWNSTNVANYYNDYITGATPTVYYQFENNGDDSSGNSHTLTDISVPVYQDDVPFGGISTGTNSRMTLLGVGK